jgi:hypothetical protein
LGFRAELPDTALLLPGLLLTRNSTRITMARLRRAISLALALAGSAAAQDTVRIKAGAPAWGSNVTLTKVYEIGGPPDYLLGAIYSTAADKAGRLYSVDLKARIINAFDANGKFLGQVGRAGDGPGEYRSANIAIVQDSILAVWDISNARLSFFGPDRKFMRASPVGRALSNLSGSLVADTASHIYLLSTFTYGEDRKPVNLPPSMVKWLRINPDGRIVDSIPVPEFKESNEPVLRTTAGNNFVPESMVRPTASGGLVGGMGTEYRFWIRPLRGPIRVIERAWTPVPLGDEERDQWIAFADKSSELDPQRPSYKIPKVKPAFRYFVPDQDGRVWVDVYAPAAKRDLPPRARPSPLPRLYWQQDHVFDVFDSMGKYLGRVNVPWGTDFVTAKGDRVWLSSKGPDDEALLTAYMLTGIKR